MPVGGSCCFSFLAPFFPLHSGLMLFSHLAVHGYELNC